MDLENSLEEYQQQQTKSKGIRFCPDCMNMLLPFEEDKMLIFKCRYCEFKDVIKDQISPSENLIHRKEIKIQNVNQYFSKDFVIDPSMARTKVVGCPKCGHNEAIFFLTSDEKNSKLVKQFICARTNETLIPECGYNWQDQQ